MFGLDAATLVAYVAAAGALILVPGQDTLVVLTRGLASARAGVGAALGVATGVLVHATAAALGLAALYRAVPTAAAVVTLAGAAYLLWLAVDTARGDGFGSSEARAERGRAVRDRERSECLGERRSGPRAVPPTNGATRATTVDAEADDDATGGARTDGGAGSAAAGYRRGLLTNVANPKVALFFLAFLPGFAGEGETATMLALGAVYALLGAAYLSAVGALAGRVGALLTGRAERAVRLGSAAVLVALAGALVVRAL